MKVYAIGSDRDDDLKLFATLQEAVLAARALLADDLSLDPLEIEEYRLVPLTKANILEIINSRGHHWAVGSHVVETVARAAERGQSRPRPAIPARAA